MDMGEEMSMNMEDHEAGTSTTTTSDTDATENELDSSSSSPPAFDSFTGLAIGLSVAVGAGSAYYFRKSKKQLEGTLKTLEGSVNP
jgi:hypothetical protein